MNIERIFNSVGRLVRTSFDLAAAVSPEGSHQQRALWAMGRGFQGLAELILEFVDGDGKLPTPEQWEAAFGPFDRARRHIRADKDIKTIRAELASPFVFPVAPPTPSRVAENPRPLIDSIEEDEDE